MVNCNLQRLDGPVRGNGKIIQELEAAFRGAGWNVIKVIWGGDWDRCWRATPPACCIKRMDEVRGRRVPDLSRPRTALTSAQEFFGKYPELLELVEHLSDERTLRSCGAAATIRVKVYNAYKRAVEHKGQPTVILAKTIKGYGWAKPARAATSRTSRRS